jgi:hypothetical protein
VGLFTRLFQRFKKKSSTSVTDIMSDPLEPVRQLIFKKYPVKKYILQENIAEQLAPQSELIFNSLQPGDEYSDVLYSYITFHQIYFHLKNYLLIKKQKYGYKNEFVDIFQDIFLDNFLIFKELSTLLKDRYTHYMNIWLDGFFISLFRKLMEDSVKKCHRIEPQLFFIIILFLSLPEISSGFEEIPFTSIIHFQESTHVDWKAALEEIIEIDIHKPSSRKSIEKIRHFLLIFLNLTVSVDQYDNLYFDEINTLKCVDLLNVLMEKTDEMIDNIKKVRKNLLSEEV